MRILVAEYAVGGGEGNSVSLLREGKAMLSTLKEGFERMGHAVVYPEAETDFEAAVDKLSKESDAGIVIAPDDKLCALTELIESNTVNLGCPADSIKICADKMRTSKILSGEGIPVPRIVSVEEVERNEEQRYVSKPRYGCASEDIFILNAAKYHKVLSRYNNADHIITEFITGDDISSSIIAGKSSVLPLTINKQFIRTEGERLRYEGGFVPYFIGREAESEIMRISERVVTILHCSGYVGIDFVLGEDGTAYVVDVNPRPTTSIVGIAKVLNYEVPDLILRAKFGTLPMAGDVKTEGRFVFNLS
ncbi:MAG: ATP-grasp domain-containing protein [Methanosarcinales archaeon]|nr:ATP-grasp domain-containing protein [Methanosarcinales archaeon]